MRVHETIAGIRAALEGTGRVALVPTMGNLHEGHIALMRQAREHGDTVVATIFVNRLQFRHLDDFDKYPRTFAADCEKLEAAGVDHLFAPSEAEMYPQTHGYIGCHVEPPPALANVLEGEFRPGHFRGVATVVMKLFQIVRPDAALFGKKDWQQLRVIRNMVADLNLPVKVSAIETARSSDGLALSSRNGYLSASERAEAPRLYRVLTKVVRAIRTGDHDRMGLEAAAMAELQAAGWIPDYIAVRNGIDLQLPPAHGPAHPPGLVVLAAARLGSTRLIDNLEV
ncbi:MAG: pantoate--beta-alanine ligase [Rhodocyclaceae bacterium]|nr:pantoate--beta-alanine ligase [Rhodocyclaceae bacterium]